MGTIRAWGEARTPGDDVSCDIKRDATSWLVSVVYTCQPQREVRGSLEAGLDWGVTSYATLANAPGQYAQHDSDRLGKMQANSICDKQPELAQARRRKRKRDYRNVRKCLSQHWRKLSNQRKDRVHKLTSQLASTHRLLVTEALAIGAMTPAVRRGGDRQRPDVAQKAGLNREILHTTPEHLLRLLKCKAQESGHETVVSGTRKVALSLTCPSRGLRRKKFLDERQHVCSCSFEAGRDEAAALHMLAMGLSPQGREPSWTVQAGPETPPRAA